MQFFKKYVLLFMAAIFLIFGIWGFCTESGQKRFDEMDGMIPFYALAFAILLIILSGIKFIYFKLKK